MELVDLHAITFWVSVTGESENCLKKQYCRSNPVPEPVEGPDFQSIWPFDRLRNQIGLTSAENRGRGRGYSLTILISAQ